MFSEEDTKVIERVRVITDLKSLHARVQRRGSVLINVLEGAGFIKNTKEQVKSLREVEDDELRGQFLKFLVKLEKQSQTKWTVKIL